MGFILLWLITLFISFLFGYLGGYFKGYDVGHDDGYITFLQVSNDLKRDRIKKEKNNE